MNRRADFFGIDELRSGDHLSIDEFHLRYQNMPEVKFAELIEGVVYMPSPLSIDHGVPHGLMGLWLGTYAMETPGVEYGSNLSVFFDEGETCLQPDGLLRILPERGGQTRNVRKGKARYIGGTPELVAEIAYSTVNYDLHEKLTACERNGVPEYLVWRVGEGEVDWFQLHGRRYRKMVLAQDGIYRSVVFPGLYLDVEAALAGKKKLTLETLAVGLSSADHAAFAQRMASARSRRKKT